MDNNDFNNDFMNYQICNSDIHSPTGKYKKKHFDSLGSIALLIIGIILALFILNVYCSSVAEKKEREEEWNKKYGSRTTQVVTTTLYEYTTTVPRYNSYNNYNSYDRGSSYENEDEYNVKDYSDSEDFYEDHYDDFDDFEDADDYYEDYAD